MTPQLHEPIVSIEDSKLYGMIIRIVETTRQKRLQEDFGLSDSEIAEIDDGLYTDPLLGECHENAKALTDKLHSYGITPHLIWGVSQLMWMSQ